MSVNLLVPSSESRGREKFICTDDFVHIKADNVFYF